jgi:hypothetical protein
MVVLGIAALSTNLQMMREFTPKTKTPLPIAWWRQSRDAITTG